MNNMDNPKWVTVRYARHARSDPATGVLVWLRLPGTWLQAAEFAMQYEDHALAFAETLARQYAAEILDERGK